LNETKEVGHLNAMCPPGLNLGSETTKTATKDIMGKKMEIFTDEL
jgi:hypothetical protein